MVAADSFKYVYISAGLSTVCRAVSAYGHVLELVRTGVPVLTRPYSILMC